MQLGTDGHTYWIPTRGIGGLNRFPVTEPQAPFVATAEGCLEPAGKSPDAAAAILERHRLLFVAVIRKPSAKSPAARTIVTTTAETRAARLP